MLPTLLITINSANHRYYIRTGDEPNSTKSLALIRLLVTIIMLMFIALL